MISDGGDEQMIFDEGTLQMLFSEIIGTYTFESWAAEVGYNDSMSDQTIYSKLPGYIKEQLGEFGINNSWMHDGF